MSRISVTCSIGVSVTYYTGPVRQGKGGCARWRGCLNRFAVFTRGGPCYATVGIGVKPWSPDISRCRGGCSIIASKELRIWYIFVRYILPYCILLFASPFACVSGCVVLFAGLLDRVLGFACNGPRQYFSKSVVGWGVREFVTHHVKSLRNKRGYYCCAPTVRSSCQSLRVCSTLPKKHL